MHLLFSFLWKNPLIRLTAFWLVLAIVGISLFTYKISSLRGELTEAVQTTQSYIQAIQKLEGGKEDPNEIGSILQAIEKYRPSVPELLDFVETVEELVAESKLEHKLNTIEIGIPKKAGQQEVHYRLQSEGTLENTQQFLQAFEMLPFAITINTMDIQSSDTSSTMSIIFTLNTKFS